MTYTLPQLSDLNYRKSTAREYLSTDRLKDALYAFAKIIKEYPDDLDAYLVLGDLYLAGEKYALALNLYLDAVLLDPNNHDLANRIELAKTEGADDRSDLDPLAESSLDILHGILIGGSEDQVGSDVDLATKLLDEIIHSHNPAELVAKNLDQIENLLPALLELNIRQAKMENRPDLASSLENLQFVIHQGNNWAQPVIGGKRVNYEKADEHFAGKVTLLVPDRNQPSVRATFIAECLSSYGCLCTMKDESDGSAGIDPDVVIACNPHINPWLMEFMATNTAQKIPIILDLDRNFEEMPVYHPDYMKMGLGSPANARAYAAALLLSNAITVPSQEFSNRLSEMGYHTRAIPDGWSHSNILWDRSAHPRNTINIGWLGNSGLLEDLVEIRRILIRVIREFPRTQLVVTENSHAYQLFGSLPDNRKLFIPEVSLEDHPYLLGQLDILAVPLKNLPFNLTQPDTILMEAGVKRLAWVSSRIPAYSAWNYGGLLADTLEEWHTNLRQLVMDSEMRAKLGDAGCGKAQQREMQLIKWMWIEAVEDVIRHPSIRGLQPTNLKPLPTEGLG